MDPEEVVELSLHAHDIGADGVGIVTPSYFNLDDRMMVEYYRGICSRLPKGFPVYVYVIPQLAHNDVSAETMQKIADACPDNVIGVKYSFADIRRMMDYCRVNGGKFSVVFGPDDLFLPALSMGADGAVSGCASCIPEPFVEVYRLWKAGDMEGAREAQYTAVSMVKKMRYGADMSIYKHVLDDRGVGGGHVKAPLLDLEEKEAKALVESLREYYR
jgi:4-hydroxy-tetrahydrodipicolinate synthase